MYYGAAFVARSKKICFINAANRCVNTRDIINERAVTKATPKTVRARIIVCVGTRKIGRIFYFCAYQICRSIGVLANFRTF
jgi:hypothetical protein